MGQGKAFPPPLPNREDYVVDFDGPDDPQHPLNWPLFTKYAIPPVSGLTLTPFLLEYSYRRSHALAHLSHLSPVESLHLALQQQPSLSM